jgi:hypothetical protein
VYYFTGVGEPGVIAPAGTTAPPNTPMTPAMRNLLIGAGVVLLGVLIYGTYTRARLLQTIAEKEGSRKALEFEAGSRAVDLLSSFGQRELGHTHNRRRRHP